MKFQSRTGAEALTSYPARAIQDQLLKDFQSRPDFSDWFSRDDEPSAPVTKVQNPRNAELEQKIQELERRIKRHVVLKPYLPLRTMLTRHRLRDQKKTWLSLRKPPPALPPLFSDQDIKETNLSDPSLFDPDEARMLGALTDPTSSFESQRSRIESRLRALQSSLEYKIDILADSVHKLSQRTDTANREADKVLALSTARLKEREAREKAASGTKETPVMEVLRSLGRILPEEGG
jgi:kinetochore protein Mis13/DSN1